MCSVCVGKMERCVEDSVVVYHAMLARDDACVMFSIVVAECMLAVFVTLMWQVPC